MQKATIHGFLEGFLQIFKAGKYSSLINCLNGHALDSFSITTTVNTQKDVDDLINLLQQAKICLPKK